MLFSGYNLGVHLLNSTTSGIALDRKKIIKEKQELTVVELDLENTISMTRNSIFIIDSWWFLKNKVESTKQKLLIKQPKTREQNSLSSSLNEKRIYNILLSFGLKDYIGEYLTFDEYFYLLYFSFSEEKSLDRFLGASPYMEDFNEILKKLGITLSRIHNIDYQSLEVNKLLDNFGFRKPIFLTSTNRSLAESVLENTSPSKKTIVDLLLKNDSSLLKEIVKIRWNNDGLIHFDMKLDHILCSDTGENMRIIDWEMGDIGDKHWDIACIWYEFIHLFINPDIENTISKSIGILNTFLAHYSHQLDNTKLTKMLGVVFLQNYYFGLFPKPEKTSIPEKWLIKAIDFIKTGSIQTEIINASSGQSFSNSTYELNPQDFSAIMQASSREGKTTIDPVLNDLIGKVNLDPRFATTIPTPPEKDILSEFIYEWYFGKFDDNVATIQNGILNSKLKIGESPAVGEEKNYIDHWWHIEGTTPKERIVARKSSEKRFVYSGDFIYSKNSRTEFGDNIIREDRAYATLFHPNYSIRKNDANETSTDLWIFGQARIRQDYPNWVRFYFHLNENLDAVYTFIQEFSKRLNEREIPFELKLRNAKSSYYRNDVAILFVHRQHFAASIDTISIVYSILKRDKYLRNSTPKFTKKFKNNTGKRFGGLAFAENPVNINESFGNWRAKIIADILIKNWDNRSQWLNIIKKELIDMGFNIHEMYRNPFDEATEYKFPYHLLTEKLQAPPLLGIDIENAFSIKKSRRYLDAAKKIAFIICREAIWYGADCTWMGFKKNSDETIFFNTLNDCEINGIGLFLSGIATLCPSESIFMQTALGASGGSLNQDIEASKIYDYYLDKFKMCISRKGESQINTDGTIWNTYNIDFSQELYTSRILADSIIKKYIDKDLPFPNAYASDWDDDLGSEFNPTLFHGLAGLGYFFLDVYDRTEDNIIINRGSISAILKINSVSSK